jgi:hypothetical protein
VVRASPRRHFSARDACEQVDRARTPSPPPRLVPHPQLDTMARGLSREQSKEKNLKKQGGNKGNTEGLTPQARAERCVMRFLVSTSRSLTRAHAPRRFATAEGVTPSASRVARPRVDPAGPDRSKPDDAERGRRRSIREEVLFTRRSSSPSGHVADPFEPPNERTDASLARDAAAMAAKKAAKDAAKAELAASSAEGAAAVAELEKRKAAQRAAKNDRKLDNFNPQLAKAAKNAGKK